MINARALAEQDLSQTLEAEFAVPVVLISPDGERITQTTGGKPLTGRVLWTRKEISPETGEPVVVQAPIVTLREASLPRVPKSGEKWFVQIPSSPRADAPMADYLLDETAAVEQGRSLGVINLPLVMAENEEAE